MLVILSTCPDDLFGSSQYDPSPVRVIVRGRDGAGSGARREDTLPGRPDRRREVEVKLSLTVSRYIDSVLAGGWLGYTPGAVARALVLRHYEALGGQRRHGPAPP